MDKQIELQEMVGGALQEKFAQSFEKVIRNLQDVNTSYKVKRAITIKLSFSQTESRDDVVVDIDVVEKLAPAAPIRTQFAIGRDLETGQIYANEYGKGVKGQMSVKDFGVKTETDIQIDVAESRIDQSDDIRNKDANQSDKVVDLRKKA